MITYVYATAPNFIYALSSFIIKIAHKISTTEHLKAAPISTQPNEHCVVNELTLSKSQTAVPPQRTNPVKLFLTPVLCIFY